MDPRGEIRVSDQPEDQEPVRAEIVGSFQEDASLESQSNSYAVWLDASNECSGIRAEALENRIDAAANILFGISPSGEHDDREPWKETGDEALNEIRDRVRMAAGEFLIRAFGPEYDPPAIVGYDPPPYFSAVAQAGENDEDDEDQD